jgi:hypothetical protein
VRRSGYTERKRGEKEDVSQWSNTVHTVENIEHWHGQNFYKVSGKTHPYVRADILRLGPENTLEEKPYRIPQHREKGEEEEEQPPPPPAEAPAPPQASSSSTLINRQKATYVKKTEEEKKANMAAKKARAEEMKNIMAKRRPMQIHKKINIS